MQTTIKSLRASILLGFAVILFLYGCQIESLTPNGVFQREKKITIEATYEMPEMETKTVRDDNAKIYWTPGDAISLFFGSGTDGGSKFLAQNDAVALKTTFSGYISAVTGGSDIDDEDTFFWGLYPYDATASCDGSSVTMSIPAIQPGMEGTFAPGMAPSLGRSQKLVLSFRNIWSGFGFTVSEPGFESITFRGNAGENIAGKARIGIDENNLPKVLEILEGVQEVTLTAPEGGFVPGQYYYMQFFPCTFESGFTVELESATQRGTYHYTKSMEYPRSTWKRAANVDTRVKEWRDRVMPDEGGTVNLVVFTDKTSHVEIPLEAQSWISYVSTSTDSNRQTITLAIQANAGAERSATVFVKSNDGTFSQPFFISQVAGRDYYVAIERAALIDFYNAMDGPNWDDNTNWCSDKPLDQWYGVYTVDNDTDPNYGRVTGLALGLEGNGLNGSIPESLVNLKMLGWLQLMTGEGDGFISNWDVLFRMENLGTLECGVWWYKESSDPAEEASWFVEIPPQIKNMKHLERLEIYGLKGDLPEELFELQDLTTLGLYRVASNGTLPTGFGKLQKLEHLHIDGGVYGTIPDDLFDCTQLKMLEILETGIGGKLSPKIGNLTQLESLRLEYSQFAGTIPAELTNIDGHQLRELSLRNNRFNGKVPVEFKNWLPWEYFWGYIVEGNNLDISDCPPHIPDFTVTTVTGGEYSSSSVHDNELTVLYNWTTWCPYSPIFIPELRSLYNRFHSQGLEIVSYDSQEDVDEMLPYIAEHEIPGICFRNDYNICPVIDLWPLNCVPTIVAYDKTGEMVYYSFGDFDDFTPFVESWFGYAPYESTDFSADGTVVNLQTATGGVGIDLILMGDAFSDRQIADGTYDSVMRDAMDAFFSEEPYKSFKNRFNVSYVNVVSLNEGYEQTGQALETGFGEGTRVYGNDNIVIDYAQNVVSYERLDDALIIVMMNKDAYAGTCYMYYPLEANDYGTGLSIAYFPTSSDTDTFNGLVSHEAGGHGFAKLADEYAYQSMGAISQETIDATHNQEAWGWYKNIDFTNNPTQVKWSPFISDNRYVNEGIGCYEGGFTYWTGVWRPTENSIMRYNTGGFNAPSRYAIWYRINKLVNGNEWNGTYEDFVAYDAVNRTPAATAHRDRNYGLNQLPPLDPPVVVGHSWRDAK